MIYSCCNNYIMLHSFCNFLSVRNDMTEKFAEHSGRRMLSGILQPIVRPRAQECLRRTRATRIFSVLQVFIHVAPVVARRIPSRTH